MTGGDDELTRLANGRWLPGHCPNPKGRPPSNGEIERVMRAKSWHRLAEIDRTCRFGAPAQAAAARQWWMDHVIGKATQKIEATVTDIGAQHLLAVAGDPAALLLEAAPDPRIKSGGEPDAPEPLPLLDAAGIEAPVQYPPPPVPEWDP